MFHCSTWLTTFGLMIALFKELICDNFGSFIHILFFFFAFLIHFFSDKKFQKFINIFSWFFFCFVLFTHSILFCFLYSQFCFSTRLLAQLFNFVTGLTVYSTLKIKKKKKAREERKIIIAWQKCPVKNFVYFIKCCFFFFFRNLKVNKIW